MSHDGTIWSKRFWSGGSARAKAQRQHPGGPGRRGGRRQVAYGQGQTAGRGVRLLF